MAQKRLTCVLSALALAVVALASQTSDFRDAVAAASSQQQFQQALNQAPPEVRNDPALSYYFDKSVQALIDSENRRYPDDKIVWDDLQYSLIEELDIKIAIEAPASNGQVNDPQKSAEEILSNPIYVDRGVAKDRNWLDGVGERIGNRLLRWLERLFRQQSRDISGPQLGVLQGSRYFFWGLIGTGIAVVLFFVLRNAKFVARKRRVGGILEEDEPERTADEYLRMSDALAAEGRYREAVRSLYLACLMKYDDARVARFQRHETNWEHLYRIEASARNPALNFRATTQHFDKVWYGNIVEGMPDYVEFKAFYVSLTEAIKMKVSA